MSNATVVRKQQCPACATMGRDNSQDNLVVYSDGGAHCFSCNHHVFPGGSSTPTKTQAPSMTLELPDNLIGISKATLEHYGVTYREKDDTHYICFPYYDTEGNITKQKTRTYDPATGKLSRDFRYHSISDGTVVLVFNVQSLFKAKGKNNVIVFEGERDLLTFHDTYGITPGWIYLAIPGTSNVRVLAARLNDNSVVDTVYLCLDDDAAGKEATANFQEICSKPMLFCTIALGKDICDAKANGTLPTTFDHFTSSFASRFIPHIVLNANAELVEYNNLLKQKPIIDYTLELPSFAKMYKPRRGSLLIVAGRSGEGKSFLCDNMVIKAIANKQHVLLCSLEMTPGEVYTRLLYQITGIYIRDLGSIDAQLKDTVVAWCKHFDTYLHVNTNPNPTIETLRQQIVALNCEVTLVIVDTISLFAPDIEWKTLGSVSYALKKLALDKVLGQPMVIGVSQVSMKSKGRNTAIGIDDLYGAGNITQAADCVIGVTSNPECNDSPVSINVCKRDRAGGKFGKFAMKFDFKIGSFYEVDANDTNEKGIVKDDF
jgi:archaellum biogenesis ATPase FlaH